MGSAILNTRQEKGKRKKEKGKRKKEQETGDPNPPRRETFGLSPQWVLNDGEPFAEALALSHDEQLARLAESAPAALPVATVIGDPCYDRILTSTAFRSRYRADVDSGDRTVVLISSTWGSNSLIGTWPTLIHRLVEEFPIDRFQFLIALHPNTWHGHGPGQLRTWLAGCLRGGAVLLPEVDGWRTGLLAADIVIGDHGSVTGYGAALGLPTLLAAFPDDDVAAGSPIAMLGATAPRLNPASPLLRQLTEAVAAHSADQASAVADLVTSAPGQALDRLRRRCYRILDLAEPEVEIPLAPLRTPPIPTGNLPPDALAFRAECVVDVAANSVLLRRYPAATSGRHAAAELDELVCCGWDEPMRSIRASAAVLTCAYDDLPGSVNAWFTAALAAHPSCQTVAVLQDDRCLLRTRDGVEVAARAVGAPPAAIAAACHAWLSATGTVPRALTVELGTRSRDVEFS